MQQQQSVHQDARRRGCIFKSSQKIFNEEVIPISFSIGPLQYKEDEKEFKSKQVVKLVNTLGSKVSRDFKKFLKQNELAIRACYGEDLSEISSDKFIEIIFTDAMFFMEVLVKSRDQPAVKLLSESQKNSLLVLENQIPLFVHLDLWERYQMRKYKPMSVSLDEWERYQPLSYKRDRLSMDIVVFVELFSRFFELKSSKISNSSRARKACHLLDLMRLVETEGGSTQTTSKTIQVKTAKSLVEFGIGLKPVSEGNLSSYQLSGWCWGFANLNLPQIQINDVYWVSRMVNMMEFERRCYQYMEERPVCQFLYLLCSLIDDEKDFNLLRECGVIVYKEKYGFWRDLYEKLCRIRQKLEIHGKPSDDVRPYIWEMLDEKICVHGKLMASFQKLISCLVSD